MRKATNVRLAVIAGAAAVLMACGGGAGSGEDPKTPASKESAQLTPMQELAAIRKDLEADVTGLTKPIDDVQSIIDDLGSLPKKHGLKAASVMGLAKATFDSGNVEITLDGDVSAEAKAEIEGVLKKLSATVTALKTTPDRVAALTTKVASLTAKVPVLATKVTSSATVTVSNPFASADAKAKAKADIDGVKQVQADTMKSISDAQGKIAGVPALATGALAKLAGSFAAGT